MIRSIASSCFVLLSSCVFAQGHQCGPGCSGGSNATLPPIQQQAYSMQNDFQRDTRGMMPLPSYPQSSRPQLSYPQSSYLPPSYPQAMPPHAYPGSPARTMDQVRQPGLEHRYPLAPMPSRQSYGSAPMHFQDRTPSGYRNDRSYRGSQWNSSRNNPSRDHLSPAFPGGTHAGHSHGSAHSHQHAAPSRFPRGMAPQQGAPTNDQQPMMPPVLPQSMQPNLPSMSHDRVQQYKPLLPRTNQRVRQFAGASNFLKI